MTSGQEPGKLPAIPAVQLFPTVLPASLFTVVSHKRPQADLYIMGDRVGSSFRITVAVLMVAFALAGALAAGLTGKAEARANIQDYLKGPNLFYPAKHDVKATDEARHRHRRLERHEDRRQRRHRQRQREDVRPDQHL